ncbi:MAG: amidohydrolase family protein [Actinomycetota bacterium]
MNAIDVHAHWFPPSLVERFGELDGPRVWPEHAESLVERVEELEAAEIGMQILGLGHVQPNMENERNSVLAARFANDLYADAARKHSRLGAFGSLPLPHVDASIAETERCLTDLGLQGLTVGTRALEKSLDDPSYTPLWEYVNQQGAIVFVHPVSRPDPALTGMSGPAFGGSHEAGLAALRLLHSGITERFPSIDWIIAPMGGTLPFLWRRFEEISQSVGSPDSVGYDAKGKLRSIYYDTTLSDDPKVLRFVADVVGLDRLVLGTDSPRVGVKDWIERTRNGLDVSPAAWADVAGKTVERLGGADLQITTRIEPSAARRYRAL